MIDEEGVVILTPGDRIDVHHHDHCVSAGIRQRFSFCASGDVAYS
jgi:hypothetical protein